MPIRRSWFNIYFEWFFRYLKTLPQTSSENGVWSVFEAKTEKQIYMIFLIFGLTFLEIFEIRCSTGSWVQKGYFWLWKFGGEFLAYFLGRIIHQVKQTLIFLWCGWKSGESKGLGCWKLVVLWRHKLISGWINNSCGSSIKENSHCLFHSYFPIQATFHSQL